MSGNAIMPTQDAFVQFVIDNNASLSGVKIQEIYNSIREIISISRATIRFGIFVTSPQARKLVSDSQQKINTNNIWQQLRASCTGNITNFYDAWGLALNEIQYDEMCYSHLVLITNGVDTTSFIYNLDSVINLLNQKLSRNPNLRVTLITAGSSGVVTSALQTKCQYFGTRCSYIVVQDSHVSIKSGLEQVKSLLRMELLQTSPNAQVQTASHLNALSLGGMRGGADKFQTYTPNVTTPSFPVSNSWVTPSVPLVIGSGRNKLNQKQVKVVNTPPSNTGTQKSYKVWVGNLPMVNPSLILDYMKQWGACKIETINGSPTQWAVVAYENQSSVDFAVKYGNASNFKGNVININKI